MEVGPIFRALMRNKLGVVLIAVQIAFTMTVIVNAVFIINERNDTMGRPSGMDEGNTFYITSIGFGDNFNEEVTAVEDLNMIRQMPGVLNASLTSALPVSGSGSSTGVSVVAGQRESSVPTAVYDVNERALSTMGLELVAGVDFTASDVLVRTRDNNSSPDNIIISAALAAVLFPELGIQAVGQTIYNANEQPLRIIGIVQQLQAPWPTSPFVEQAMLSPLHVIDGTSTYLVRTEPGQRDRLMVEVEELLAARNGERILRGLRSMEDTREESYRVDSAMSKILYVIIATLVFITAMGIVGLAVFSINRRKKQIGTRRALGATQGDILRYFLLENLMITGCGVLVGAVLTLAFNMFLVQSFDMPRIDWYYAPVGMLLLMLVGQLAVIGPSQGAARITPALATRSV